MLQKKGIFSSGYSFRIDKKDMGSVCFMKELRATECGSPWHLREGRRVHLYLDQFGSFCAVADSVSSVFFVIFTQGHAVPFEW